MHARVCVPVQVNCSSLLLGGQEAISQNGNIEGPELLSLTDTPEPPEHSSESEQERVATSDPLTGKPPSSPGSESIFNSIFNSIISLNPNHTRSQRET